MELLGGAKSVNGKTKELSNERKGYSQSCDILHGFGLIDERQPPLPARMPRFDDEGPLGVSFFRTSIGNAALDNLTLPRTFFGRSLIESVSFQNTDLSELCLCWNDFVSVNFTSANLSDCDLRASSYTGVNFSFADLTGADLRQSDFLDCDFGSANMSTTKLTAAQGQQLRLSDLQKSQISWKADDGDEPGGG